jgi:hypothetical protein
MRLFAWWRKVICKSEPARDSVSELIATIRKKTRMSAPTRVNVGAHLQRKAANFLFFN